MLPPLIDTETGILDQAMWRDSLTEFDFTLPDIQSMYTDLYKGILPNDNPVPEPAAGVLLAVSVGMLILRRRRNAL